MRLDLFNAREGSLVVLLWGGFVSFGAAALRHPMKFRRDPGGGLGGSTSSGW